MRVFKTKYFNNWAKDQSLSDKNLFDAAKEVAEGKYEASLGKKIFKKRIALAGKGKSGSTRNIIAFQKDNNSFFMYGFAKNERTNITAKELTALQMAAKIYLEKTDKQLDKAVKESILFEVKDDE
ncbi:MAG: type II toxin-antitoxin system RelE/ParE family toxin [Gammaproteobacteria bacterium]